MSAEALRQRLKELFVSSLGLQTTPDEIADDAPLFGKDSPYGTDSLDAAVFAMAVEDDFGVKLPQIRFAELNSIRAIADAVQQGGVVPAVQR